MLTIAVLTYIPSPYQVELFDALSEVLGGRFFAIYRRRLAPDRQWTLPDFKHAHCCLEDECLQLANAWVEQADLVIFSSYQSGPVRELIARRAKLGKPWAFWGERPGVRWSGFTGRVVRRWTQRQIRASSAPIWGIGEWAIEGYRSEYGQAKTYFNVPYFSNLEPYFNIDRGRCPQHHRRRFLFSGSLIKRKGVDLLARAFNRLSTEVGDVSLTLVGAGPLEPELQHRLYHLGDRVAFCGFLQWENLPQAYADADILCAPSRYDGWGLVVVEGLAAGMPVISTTCSGAARELITPRSGWLIEPDDEDALLAAMRSAATLDGERLAQYSVDARIAVERQTVAAGVKRFLDAAEQTTGQWIW